VHPGTRRLGHVFYEETRRAAIDFADVAVSLYARAVGDPTSTQEEIEAIAAGSEAS
jgi:hypothetical protein